MTFLPREWIQNWSATRLTRDGNVAASTPPPALDHPSGTQATHDAHSDPGYNTGESPRGATLTCPLPQNAQPRMRKTSDGEHDKSDWENIPEDEDNTRCGPGNLPDTAPSAGGQHWQRASQLASSETSHVFHRSLRSATSNKRPRERSIIWKNLRDKHAEVLRSRMSLRESSILLRARQRTIDDAEVQLLPAMTAALTDPTISTMKKVIDELRALQALRQSLEPDLEAHDQLENQLIAEEAMLVELETNVYAELSRTAEFPAGLLDFTQDDHPDTATVVSVISNPTVPPPEKQEYDRCLRQINVIREKLMDMQSEHDQLLREEAKRKRVGRALDAFSIQVLRDFDNHFEGLTLDLDRAEAEFVLAEATWTSRRRTIELKDDASRAAQTVAREEESSSSLDLSSLALLDVSDPQEDAYESVESLVSQNALASEIARRLVQPEKGSGSVYQLPSEDENGETISQARFINQWLLQRIQESPTETARFANNLAQEFPSHSAQNLIDLALSCWKQDGVEERYIAATKRAEDRSLRGSLAPHNGLSQIVSDKAQSQGGRLSLPRSEKVYRRLSGRLTKTEIDSIV